MQQLVMVEVQRPSPKTQQIEVQVESPEPRQIEVQVFDYKQQTIRLPAYAKVLQEPKPFISRPNIHTKGKEAALDGIDILIDAEIAEAREALRPCNETEIAELVYKKLDPETLAPPLVRSSAQRFLRRRIGIRSRSQKRREHQND